MTAQLSEANEAGRPVILLNEAALDRSLDMLGGHEDARIVVAGRSLMRMSLAELALPGAQIVWTDFRQSASLRTLHCEIQRLGGLDRLVLAVDGEESEAIFSVLSAILTFLPALRRRRESEIVLAVEAGQAVATLQAFLARLGPRLESDGIKVVLQIEQTRPLAA